MVDEKRQAAGHKGGTRSVVSQSDASGFKSGANGSTLIAAMDWEAARVNTEKE